MKIRWLTAVALVIGSAVPVTATAAAAAAPVPDGSVIRTWTALAENSVRTAKSVDAAAARAYAMVDAAMYDAVNALLPAVQRHAPAIVAPSRNAAGDAGLAAATAAHDVLAALYPQATYPSLAADRDAQLAADAAAVSSRGAADRGRAWGETVAAGVLAARANDVPATVETEPGSEAIGELPANWVGSQWRQLRSFVIPDAESYVQDSRPALDTIAYARAFDEVKYLGDAQRVDPEADATYGFWALGNGTEQPAGAWLTVAAAVSAQRSLSLADTARLFALESLAMADTVAPTYETKYRFHSWRPVTAIAKADFDPNPATVPADHTWVARGGGAGSPEHWSGHSSFSAAGATVLAGFFCDDHISFTLVTSLGQSRSYDSFSAASAEAGRSRVLGGLHFEFSNQAGLEAGRAIGGEVLAHALLATHGPTHYGSCPR